MRRLVGGGLLLAWVVFTGFVLWYSITTGRDMADPDGRARRGRDLSKPDDLRAYQAQRDHVRRGRDSLDNLKRSGAWPLLLGVWAVAELSWLGIALFLLQ